MPSFFQPLKDEVAWITEHYLGAMLWKGQPKFAVNSLPAMHAQEPQRTAEAMRRTLSELIRL